MPQIIPCPHCGTRLNIPDQVLGKNVQCTAAGCGKAFLAQASPPAAPPATPIQVGSSPAPPVPPLSTQRPRRNDRDDRDDYEEEFEERGIRRDLPPEPSTGAQLGLGVASLVVGILAALIAFIPCVGFLGLIPAGIGLVLGIIGIIIGLVQERKGLGFPIAGMIVNCLAVVIVVVWYVVFMALVATGINQAAVEAKKQQERLMKGDERVLDKLERIAKAMHKYHETHGKFPAAKDKDNNLSWRVHLLPFLDEANLFKRFRLNERWDSVHNYKLLEEEMPGVYKPEKPRFGGPNRTPDETYFMVFTGPDGPFKNTDSPKMTDIRDGTTKTIMIAEADFSVPWSKPADIPFNRNGFAPKLGRRFDLGFHAVTFASDAVYVRVPPDDRTLRAWISHNGSEKARKIGN